jgi:hypothetical protein
MIFFYTVRLRSHDATWSEAEQQAFASLLRDYDRQRVESVTPVRALADARDFVFRVTYTVDARAFDLEGAHHDPDIADRYSIGFGTRDANVDPPAPN